MKVRHGARSTTSQVFLVLGLSATVSLKCHIYFKNKQKILRIDYTLINIQKHKIVEVGCGTWSHTPTSEQGQLQQVAQGGVTSVLHLHSWECSTNSPDCLCQQLITLTVKEVFPLFMWNFLYLNVSIASSAVTGYH